MRRLAGGRRASRGAPRALVIGTAAVYDDSNNCRDTARVSAEIQQLEIDTRCGATPDRTSVSAPPDNITSRTVLLALHSQ